MVGAISWLLSLILVVVLSSDLSARAADPYEAFSVLQVEKKPAPDFSLPTVDGKTVRLSDYKGKVILLGFFKTFWPNCRRELPTKEKLFREFKEKDPVVLAISFREPEDLVKDFQKEFGLSSPVLVDSQGTVSEKYEITGHPVTFLIDREGFLVGQVLGERDWSSPEAKALLRNLLANSP